MSEAILVVSSERSVLSVLPIHMRDRPGGARQQRRTERLRDDNPTETFRAVYACE